MMMHASHRQTNNVVERSCWTTLKGCFDSRARFHTASESFVDEAHVLPTGERFGAQTTCDAFERDDHEVLVCACAPEPPRIVSMPRTNSPLARPASPPLFFLFSISPSDAPPPTRHPAADFCEDGVCHTWDPYSGPRDVAAEDLEDECAFV